MVVSRISRGSCSNGWNVRFFGLVGRTFLRKLAVLLYLRPCNYIFEDCNTIDYWKNWYIIIRLYRILSNQCIKINKETNFKKPQRNKNNESMPLKIAPPQKTHFLLFTDLNNPLLLGNLFLINRTCQPSRELIILLQEIIKSFLLVAHSLFTGFDEASCHVIS